MPGRTFSISLGTQAAENSDVTLALQGFLHHKIKILLPHLTTPTVNMLLMVSELYWASACTNKKITSSSWLRAFRRPKICHQLLKRKRSVIKTAQNCVCIATVFRSMNNFFGKDKLCISGFQANRREDKTEKFNRKSFLIIVESHRVNVMKIKPVNKLFSSFESSAKNNYHSQTFSPEPQTRQHRIMQKSRQVIEIAARTFAR